MSKEWTAEQMEKYDQEAKAILEHFSDQHRHYDKPKFKVMDVLYQDVLRAPRCLVLEVNIRYDGKVSYTVQTEKDGNGSVPSEVAKATKEEWLQWMDKFRDELTGKEFRWYQENVERELFAPESWIGFRKRFDETGDPYLKN